MMALMCCRHAIGSRLSLIFLCQAAAGCLQKQLAHVQQCNAVQLLLQLQLFILSGACPVGKRKYKVGVPCPAPTCS